MLNLSLIQELLLRLPEGTARLNRISRLAWCLSRCTHIITGFVDPATITDEPVIEAGEDGLESPDQPAPDNLDLTDAVEAVERLNTETPPIGFLTPEQLISEACLAANVPSSQTDWDSKPETRSSQCSVQESLSKRLHESLGESPTQQEDLDKPEDSKVP
ncbi:unnamed protein product [Protopolystoma xenopodis]|uniref:Uncharacterized protein n=1 Tax=Protopolystoma xenopodis TaxID=117903 RepID=A0A448WRK4_9PLAT|nr:unnamed protein product [Protopolystoma xenopodis]